MKLIFLTIIFIIAISSTSSTGNLDSLQSFNNIIINKLYEKIRGLIQTGSEEHNVPVWDPHQFTFTTFDVSGKWFSLKANITNGTFTGLGDFYVTKSVFNNDCLYVDNKIIFPQLKITADHYEMEGAVLNVLPLSGRGKLDIEVNYITSISRVYMKPSDDGKSILVDKIENPWFNVEKIISHTEFDNNFDAILNNMIADLLAGYISRFNGLIFHVYAEQLVDLLNNILGKFETWHLLN